MPRTTKHEIKKIETNEITTEQKASMKTRVLVAIPIVIVLFSAIIFGGWVMMGFTALFTGFGIYEIIKARQKKFQFWVWILTYLFGYLIVFWPLIDHNVEGYMVAMKAGTTWEFQLEQSFAHLNVPITIIGLCIILYFLMAVLDKNFTFRNISHLFTFTFMVALGLQAMIVCRFYPFAAWEGSSISSTIPFGSLGFKWGWSAGLLAVVFIIVALTDVFAYFGGMLFGKHKMSPRVSPKKTWEGFFIGWGMGSVFAIAIMHTMAAFGYPVLPILDMAHWWRTLTLGIVLPLIGTLGDLAFSLIKRGEKIKDFSNLLPGHGGILDRLDSQLFACLGTAIIISFFVQGWIY